MCNSEFRFCIDNEQFTAKSARIVSEEDNLMRLKDKAIGDYQLTEILDIAQIGWDSSGGWLEVPDNCFECYKSTNQEFRGNELKDKKCVYVSYKKGFETPVCEVPLTFLAYLLEQADIPFVIEKNKIFISK
jgi:hypothetical protein